MSIFVFIYVCGVFVIINITAERMKLRQTLTRQELKVRKVPRNTTARSNFLTLRVRNRNMKKNVYLQLSFHGLPCYNYVYVNFFKLKQLIFFI